MRLILITPRGIEPVVAEEVYDLIGRRPSIDRGSVTLEDGALDAAYRLRLGVRAATRLLRGLGEYAGADGEAIYRALRAYPFETLFGIDASFSVEVVGKGEEPPHFLTLRAKDAIVDRFRERLGERPSVDKRRPDARVHIRLMRDRFALSIDLGDGALSHRGYRPPGAPAPLREHLAAALLLLAGAPRNFEEGRGFIDRMCGSGTLAVEAAMMARRIAPGLARPLPNARLRFHDAELYRSIRDEFRALIRAPLDHPTIVASDLDAASVELAREAARRAGVEESIRFECVDFLDSSPPDGVLPGLILMNPPYGERLGDTEDLHALYEAIGDRFRWEYRGYRAGIFSGDESLLKSVGLRAEQRVALDNGSIPSTLALYAIREEMPRERPHWRTSLLPEAAMLRNRLRKNLRRLAPYVERRGLTAYRIYDRDIPEFNFAVDRYADSVLIQEWAPPRTVDRQLAARRARDLRIVLEEELGIPSERFHYRRRRRRARFEQIESSRKRGERFIVHEGDLRLLVTLEERFDTGLYLDHRELRRMAAREAGRSEAKRFLNLFAYTGSASVAAALEGATTVSVDLSGTYLDWAGDNFEASGLSLQGHQAIQDDAIAFLEDERELYDVIFCNPPSYSRSKDARAEFEVKRDHERLIQLAMSRLDRAGSLYFSTHARGFELSRALVERYAVEALSPKSVPPDFRSDAHHAFRLRHRETRHFAPKSREQAKK